MPKFRVIKKLELYVELEAETAQAAYDKQLEMNDQDFVVMDCQYSVEYAATGASLDFEVEFQ
jgi:hypothetical protein